MGSFDITFCCKEDCFNFDCERNITRTYGYPFPVSVGKFKDCKYWVEKAKNSNNTKYKISDLLGDE